MSAVGKKVGRPRLHRNKFNLSHERRMSADMFFLYPCLVDDCIPGDIWRIGNEMVVRMNPLFCPIMHEINVFVHYYFVPYRLLWDQWEDYFTGGRDGKFVAEEPRDIAGNTQAGSLWDYLGFESYADFNITRNQFYKLPLAYPRMAYNFIWNEYYRDPNLEDEFDFKNPALGDNPKGHLGLVPRCWEKDYFTSMLPWQQRGDSPAVPIDFTGSLPINWGNFTTIHSNTASSVNWVSFGGLGALGTDTTVGTEFLDRWFNSARVPLENLNDYMVGFDVNDMRLMFQIQRYLERNARVGPRYVEQLRGRYKSGPNDDRLQRPEYIGGSKTPIIISEVLQTSESGSSPQGNMSGHGLSADHTYCGTYKVREHGLIMGIMSIMPKPMYMNGVDRVWLKTDKFDYPHPEFVNLSEQAVMQSELMLRGPGPSHPDRIIGYQGRYDEYRFKRSTVHGLFRGSTFAQWHMARAFSHLSPPTLNLDLVRPNSLERDGLKRGMMVPSEPMFLITFGNKLHVTRSLPYRAEPGLIDHN